jgi:hypothetical protein
MDTRFTDDSEEYERAEGDTQTKSVAYTAALFLPHRVGPLCNALRVLAKDANAANVLNSISSYWCLRAIRSKFVALAAEYQTQYDDCLRRLAEPVQGVSAIDGGWVQGFTTAAGTAAILELSRAESDVSEALDRKSAYAVACFSLYIAVLSLLLTVAFGWLSLK